MRSAVGENILLVILPPGPDALTCVRSTPSCSAVFLAANGTEGWAVVSEIPFLFGSCGGACTSGLGASITSSDVILPPGPVQLGSGDLFLSFATRFAFGDASIRRYS